MKQQTTDKAGNLSVDVLGIGGSLFDTFFVVSDYPVEDTKLKAKATLNQCGGPVATALTAASKLGMSCAFIGAMGDDPAGQAMLADFHVYSVHTSGIRIRTHCQSAASMILVNEAKKTRTIIWSPGDAAPLGPAEIPENLIRQAKVLHLDGLQHDAALAVAQQFKAAGKRVSFDAGSFHPGVEALLPLADWLICAEEFVLRLTGAQSAEEAVIEAFKRYQPEVVAATQGKSGGLWTTDGRTVQRYLPAPVTVVDTTGAGDVFHGAAIYARLQGWDWPEVFAFASAVAALKCTKLGGRTGIPTREEVDAYLQTRGGVL
ncbi:MAG: PfkB family carbohydrate kinase [Bacillota bacterium]|nr:PfkB family carbohydrate kinase [Bacillota bacterium]